MRKIFLLAVLAITVSSCYYDNQVELYPVDPTGCDTKGLTYDADVKAIFVSNCTVSDCHVSGAQLPTLETYAQVASNISKIEFQALIEKSMPKVGRLGSCEQRQLTQWIIDGYPEK
tara:strand:- start:68917 stop:69264 length:348 start_codon:yes stop_codon:yes gene_type:complete